MPKHFERGGGTRHLKDIQNMMSLCCGHRNLVVRMSFSGRATQKEYLAGNTFFFWLWLAPFVVLGALYGLCGHPTLCSLGMSPMFASLWAFGIFMFWVNSSQRVRRFHDFGLSWFVAWGTSPLLPLLAMWYWVPPMDMYLALPPDFNPSELSITMNALLQSQLPTQLGLMALAVFLFVFPALIPAREAGCRYREIMFEQQMGDDFFGMLWKLIRASRAQRELD